MTKIFEIILQFDILVMLYNFQLADQLKVIRKGQQHQAGSDSLLTAQTFFKIKERFFEDTWDQVIFFC